MSCNGVGALKCQCLCQLPKHAARLQSKITSTSDSASLKCNRLLFLLSMYLALGDIEGIFKQYLKHLSFSPLTPVPFKYTLKKLLVLSKISGAVIAFTFTWAMTDCKAACATTEESASWHAGQSVLTLQVNRWKALEETTISFKTKKKKKNSKHSLAWYYWSRHAERLRPRLSKLV